MKEPKQIMVEASTWSREHLEGLVLRYGIRASAIGCVLALIGTTLGAVNFISPTHYPVWVLACWLMGDILLVTLVSLYIVYYLFLLGQDIAQEAVGGSILLFFAFAGSFVGAMFALMGRHFAWVSVACLFLLVGVIVTNSLILINRHD
jgi:hypothetical protein